MDVRFAKFAAPAGSDPTTSRSGLLLTARSEKVTYYPDIWSCSIGEQHAPDDLRAGARCAIERWGRRPLQEKLGLTDDTHPLDEARILSIFPESDVLNISICARVCLRLIAWEVDRVLHQGVRSDYEFADWNFLHPDDLPCELAHATRSYHPTSGCCMQMELFHRHGSLRPLAVATRAR
jgi:hypothetical protein